MSFALHPAVVALAMLAGAAAMLAWRAREASAPVTVRGIVAPPLGMSTGLAMFLAPATRVPWTWAASAFLLGALVLALPVLRTSRLVRDGEAVRVRRSRAFVWILLGLVAVRFGLRAWVERFVTPLQTGGLFFLVAYGTVVRWRAGMLLAYLRLRRAAAGPDAPGPRGARPDP